MESGEDVEEEIALLEAIYTSELIEIKKNDRAHFERIALKLEPATGDDHDKKYVCLTILFTLPPTYPDDSPEISISNPRGLAEEHVNELYGELLESAKEKKGQCMLYDLIEMAKESLTQSNLPHGDCAVCLTHFDSNDVFTKTDCYHYFHTQCLLRYVRHEEEEIRKEKEDILRNNPHKKIEEKEVVCPVCRCAMHGITATGLQITSPPIRDSPFTFKPSPALQQQQKRMKELYEKQQKQGGIIDLEEERNKYLLPAVSVKIETDENSDALAAVPLDLKPDVDSQHENSSFHHSKGRGQHRNNRRNNKSRDHYDRNTHGKDHYDRTSHGRGHYGSDRRDRGARGRNRYHEHNRDHERRDYEGEHYDTSNKYDRHDKYYRDSRPYRDNNDRDSGYDKPRFSHPRRDRREREYRENKRDNDNVKDDKSETNHYKKSTTEPAENCDSISNDNLAENAENYVEKEERTQENDQRKGRDHIPHDNHREHFANNRIQKNDSRHSQDTRHQQRRFGNRHSGEDKSDTPHDRPRRRENRDSGGDKNEIPHDRPSKHDESSKSAQRHYNRDHYHKRLTIDTPNTTHERQRHEDSEKSAHHRFTFKGGKSNRDNRSSGHKDDNDRKATQPSRTENTQRNENRPAKSSTDSHRFRFKQSLKQSDVNVDNGASVTKKTEQLSLSDIASSVSNSDTAKKEDMGTHDNTKHRDTESETTNREQKSAPPGFATRGPPPGFDMKSEPRTQPKISAPPGFS